MATGAIRGTGERAVVNFGSAPSRRGFVATFTSARGGQVIARLARGRRAIMAT